MGTVRLGTPEGFGTQVLAPRISQLRAEHPLLQLQVMAQPQFPSLVTREVEILVTLERPEVGRYRVSRLTESCYYLYASPDYLRSHPPITDLSDLADHVFVDYVHDGFMSERLRYVEELIENPTRSFTSTSVVVQREAAAAGLGLVLLPPYMVWGRQDLVRVLPGAPQVTRTVWLAAPEDLFKISRIRVVWDYLRALAESAPKLFRD